MKKFVGFLIGLLYTAGLVFFAGLSFHQHLSIPQCLWISFFYTAVLSEIKGLL